MMPNLFLVFINCISLSYAVNENINKRVNTYSETLFGKTIHVPEDKMELIWGDDIFVKNPSIEKVENADIIEKFPLISGTLVDGDNSLAIVNGNPLGIGDMINDRKIYEIGSDYVLLEKNNSLTAVKVGKKKPDLTIDRITGEPVVKDGVKKASITTESTSNIIMDKLKSIGEVFK